MTSRENEVKETAQSLESPTVVPETTVVEEKKKSFPKFSLRKKPKSDVAEPILAVAVSEEKVAEPANIQVLEKYPLIEPFAYASIVKDLDRGTIQYNVEEPKLTSADQVHLKRLKEILNQVITMKQADLQSKETAAKYLVKKSKEIFNDYDFKIDKETQNRLLYCVIRDNLGFGKIDALMHDQLIEDLSCDGVNVPIFVWHRKAESIPTNVKFETAEELDSFALRLAYMCGSHVSIAQPLLDASLPDEAE